MKTQKNKKEKWLEFFVFKGLYSFFQIKQEGVYLVLGKKIDWIDYYPDLETFKVAFNNRPMSLMNKQDVRDEINNWMSLLKEEVFSSMHDHSNYIKFIEKYENMAQKQRILLGWE